MLTIVLYIVSFIFSGTILASAFNLTHKGRENDIFFLDRWIALSSLSLVLSILCVIFGQNSVEILLMYILGLSILAVGMRWCVLLYERITLVKRLEREGYAYLFTKIRT